MVLHRLQKLDFLELYDLVSIDKIAKWQSDTISFCLSTTEALQLLTNFLRGLQIFFFFFNQVLEEDRMFSCMNMLNTCSNYLII